MTNLLIGLEVRKSRASGMLGSNLKENTPESEDNNDHDLELEEDASCVQISEQKNAKHLKNLHNYFKKYKTIKSLDEALDPSTISSPSLTTSEGKKNGESDGSPVPDLSKNSFKNIGER